MRSPVGFMAADSAKLFLPEPLAETLSQYVVAGFSPRSINFYPDLYFFCPSLPFGIGSRPTFLADRRLWDE